MREPSLDSKDYFLKQKQPSDISKKAYELFIQESSKGCFGKVYDRPLKTIAPPFELFTYNKKFYEELPRLHKPDFLEKEILHDCISFVPRQSTVKKDFWEAGFNMFSQFANINEPFYIELLAMNGSVHWQIRFPKEFKSLIKNSIISNFPKSKQLNRDYITELTHPTNLITYYPHPPYYRNLITPQSKMNIALHSLLSIIDEFDNDEWFLYRLSIEPALHSWSKNCSNLYSYEKNLFALYHDLSSEGVHYVNPTFESKKAISTKISPEGLPLFFVTPMIAFKSSRQKEPALKSFMNSFRFGDFHYHEIDYDTIGYEKTRNILDKSNNYVEGHLLNREELAHLFLQPCESTFERFGSLFNFPKSDNKKDEGITIGRSGKRNVILPYENIPQSIGIIGNQGFGKSNLLLSTLSQISKSDSGIIVFYFNDLQFCRDLISSLPENRLADTIFATPSLNGKVLARNLVDETSMRPLVQASALAYGLENATANLGVNTKLILKNALLMAISHGSTSIEDILSILDKNDPHGKIIRSSYKKKTKSKNVLKAIHLIEEARSDARTVHNKLQDLFDSEESSTMLSYSGRNLISYKDIVENNKILIWYLGGLGSAANAIASMELSLIHEHFLQYGKIHPTPHYKTLLAIDEVQRIQAQAIAHSIRQNRKHGLSFALATQSLVGVDPALKEAFDLISNLIAFQCTEYDARYVTSKASGIVKSADLMSLDKFEMYARLMSSQNVFRANTLKFKTGENSKIDFVIQNSLANYYITPNETEVNTPKYSNKTKPFSPDVMKQLDYFEED